MTEESPALLTVHLYVILVPCHTVVSQRCQQTCVLMKENSGELCSTCGRVGCGRFYKALSERYLIFGDRSPDHSVEISDSRLPHTMNRYLPVVQLIFIILVLKFTNSQRVQVTFTSTPDLRNYNEWTFFFFKRKR